MDSNVSSSNLACFLLNSEMSMFRPESAIP